MKSRLWIVAVVLLAGCATGSEGAPPVEPMPGNGNKPMPMPQGPAPEMAKLDFLVGHWAVEETHHPNHMMPKGGKGRGGMKCFKRLTGHALVMNYVTATQGSPMDFHGHGVLSYDAGAGEYVMTWFDNMKAGSAWTGRAGFEGNSLVVRGTIDMMGQVKQSRMSYTPMGGSIHWKMETDAGDGWKTEVEATYTRR